MAEKALQDVEDELTCSICLDTYTDPRLLQCFHVYCLGCIRRVGTDRNQQGELLLACPECRQVTTLPPGGAKNLKSAFHINRFLRIMKEHKEKDKKDEPADVEDRTTPASNAPRCSEHPTEELQLYCETCGEVICYKCAVEGLGKHYNHKKELLEVAFHKYKEEITSSLQILDKQYASVSRALQQVVVCRGKVAEQQEAIAANIRSYCQEGIRKTQMTTQLHRVSREKLRRLAAQEEQLKSTQAQLKSCLDFMKENMKMDSYHDVLEMKISAVAQIKKLIASFQSQLLTPCTEANMLHSESPDSRDVEAQNNSAAIIFLKGKPLEVRMDS